MIILIRIFLCCHVTNTQTTNTKKAQQQNTQSQWDSVQITYKTYVLEI